MIVGSAPDAVRCERWGIPEDVAVVCVNNAWRLGIDWRFHLFPNDFPVDRRPAQYGPSQVSISNSRGHAARGMDYHSHVERFGGLLWCGSTIAFAAGYWAMSALRCVELAYLGCDMVYDDGEGKTHFYGSGGKDPLRQNLSLRSIEAKSSRLEALARARGCRIWNLSKKNRSRLTFPRIEFSEFASLAPSAAPMSTSSANVDVAAILRDERRIFSGLRIQDAVKACVTAEEVDRIDRRWLRL